VSNEKIRQATAADYDAIVLVVNDWWGRDLRGALPRLFLDHFHATSLIAEDDGTMIGFLVGFVSPSAPGEGYIHYVAVDPGYRGRGIARHLYDEFIARVKPRGCRLLHAITSPVNQTSIAFHRSMGFDVRGPVPDYNGPGRDMIVFTRSLADQ
jgi:ribosomal protein S18 acetylase RimI-like enzyme